MFKVFNLHVIAILFVTATQFRNDGKSTTCRNVPIRSVMKNSDAHYQPLLTDDPKLVNENDKEAESKLRQTSLNQNTGKIFAFHCCSKLAFVFVIAVFVALYLLTTLEISFVANKRPRKLLFQGVPQVSSQSFSIKDNIVLQEKLLKPFSNLLNKLSKSVDKLDQNVNKNLSSILPARIQLNDYQTMEHVEKESNLPATYWDRWNKLNFGKHSLKKKVKYCSNVMLNPPHETRMNNLYWQITESKNRNIKLYLYNAYYDNRLWGKPVVKVITTTDQQVEVEKAKWWCLLWFDQLKSPVLSRITDFYTVFPEYWNFGVAKGVYGPQIATCEIPLEYINQIPQTISVQATDDCSKIYPHPDNVLRVIYNKRKTLKTSKPSIGICVQAFRFGTYDVSVRLVEWLEMVKLMGADQVYFYVYGATQNMNKVMKHYSEKESFVNWRQLTLPGENQPNVKSLYNFYFTKIGGKFWPQELLELNDCLYRNIYTHDYVAVFDIDEMIMPQTANNWHQLLHNVMNNLSEKDKKEKAYFVNRHAYVYEMFEETEMLPSRKPIPNYLYMQRHVNRAELLADGINIKCFHRTDKVFAVHNHYPMRCINTTGHHSCNGMTINPNKSILMHYRRNRSPPEKCPTPNDLRKCSVRDTTAWRFFDKIADSVKEKLITIFG